MPYYQREWNAVLGKQAPPKQGNKKLRKLPHGEFQEGPPPEKQTNVDKEKVLYMQQMLKSSVEELMAAKCATPIKGDDNFLNFVILKDQMIFDGKYSNIFACFNHQHVENTMVCRIYQPNSMIIPENDMFLKVLRHIGTKHPAIIQTVDIYADEGRHIYLFQEYANKGNAYDYLRSGCSVSEKQMCKWAQSITSAMDFLGGLGIAHRSIQPKHMLLKSLDNEIIAKLSSFRDAVLYWDSTNNDIIDQPCKPLQKRQYGGFQAPEVFGEEGEFFNPVDADVWSLGCTMFYLAARLYPFSLQKPEPHLDETITKSVNGSRLSEGAKKWLIGLMRANTEERTQFDAIATDPWFNSV